MRILILTLLLIGALSVLVSDPCIADDCNYGKRCYTTSQCDCGFVCRRIEGDPFGNKRCQF